MVLIYTKVSEVLTHTIKYLWEKFIILTPRAWRVRLKRMSLVPARANLREKVRGLWQRFENEARDTRFQIP